MRRTFGTAALMAAALLAAPVAPAEAQQSVPGWLQQEMSELTAGSGRWITDNSQYRSDAEPFDQYGLEWKWGIGRQSITGRLFGLRAGREVATFWEFRLYWHPGRGEALLVQWGGDGRLGEGPMRPTGNGVETEAVQVFHAPDGSSSRTRHLTVTESGEHRTRSFSEADGKWVPDRTYTWKRTEA